MEVVARRFSPLDAMTHLMADSTENTAIPPATFFISTHMAKREGTHLEASHKKRRAFEIFKENGLDFEEESDGSDDVGLSIGPSHSHSVVDESSSGESEESDDEGISRAIFTQSSMLDDLPSRLPPNVARFLDRSHQAVDSPTILDFASLGLSNVLVSSLNSMSIRKPTPVQAACIPPLLAGRDCIGNAKTGQGKTIAFALPILHKLSQDPYGIFALVLTPTRELAFQICEQFAILGAPLNIRTSVVVGGMDMVTQATELSNRPHVVIATPGRLVDHLNSSSGGGNEWSLGRVKFLVLDEADRLLSSTFAPDLARIFATLPQDRQTCLFTATLTPSIDNLANAKPRTGKEKPFVHKDKATIETVDTLKQQYILCPSHVREVYLYHLLCNPPDSIIHLRRAIPLTGKQIRQQQKKKPSTTKPKKTTEDSDAITQPPPTIIFVRHARTAAYLTHLLQNLELRSTSLHSRLTQPQRLTSLNLFRACVVPILICTDVGSRGLDMDDVGMVINWDLPSSKSGAEDSPGLEGGAEETYVHRVGRTARMGKGGFAVSFVTERNGDEETIKNIEKKINLELTELKLPEEKVLEKLNLVSTAKRVANMELHDSDFGKREEIHKAKKAQRQARDIMKQ